MINNDTYIIGQYYNGNSPKLNSNNFDLSCPYLKHYFDKSQINYDFSQRFEFIYQDPDYKYTDPAYYYLEDVEKAVRLLKHDIFDLVGKAPITREAVDILYQQNRMERGVLTTNRTCKRCCVGTVETERIIEVLSKEIAIKFVKLAEISFNYPDRSYYNKDIVLEMTDTIESIKEKIMLRVDIMNYQYKLHPNVILLPVEVYNYMFDADIDVYVMTKTNNKIHDIDIWVNPHVKDIVIYHNQNSLNDVFIGTNVNQTSLIFTFQMLYGVNFSKEVFESESLITDRISIMNQTIKHKFKYALVDIGMDTTHNFAMIPVDQNFKNFRGRN